MSIRPSESGRLTWKPHASRPISRRMKEGHGDNMTEEDTPKTPTDLLIEQLTQRLDTMEASHKAEVDELKKANKGLWAQLHPVTADPEPAKPEPPVWDTEKAVEAFRREMGIKED